MFDFGGRLWQSLYRCYETIYEPALDPDSDRPRGRVRARLGCARRGQHPERADVIARIHSLGSQGWGTDASGRTFKEIWNLPVTGQFREDALNKLALAIGAEFEPKGRGTPGGAARLIRPLLNDLISREAHLEVLQDGPGSTEGTIAARLDEARSKLWQNNVTELDGAWSWRSTASARRINSWRRMVGRPCIGPVVHRVKVNSRGLMHRLSFRTALERPNAGWYWLKVEADLARAAVSVVKPPGKYCRRLLSPRLATKTT